LDSSELGTRLAVEPWHKVLEDPVVNSVADRSTVFGHMTV